jgi:UDP-2,3-diacylglucosamine pyrophosphatase LpxH
MEVSKNRRTISPFDKHEGSDDLLGQLRAEGMSQSQCAVELTQVYKDKGFTKSSVNKRLKRHSGGIDQGHLMALIRKGKVSVSEVANHFRVCPAEAIEAIKKLQEGHVLLEVVDDEVSLGSSIRPSDEPFVIDWRKHKETLTPVAFIADTHIGSKYERLDALNNFYDRCVEQGVKQVYLAGNLIEGDAKFNTFDRYVSGFNDQMLNFLEKFPQRKGITTYFLTGDDHEGWYVQRENINVGETIQLKAREMGRTDLVYIGHVERDIEFKQDKGSCIVRVIHAGGGSSYALSYTSQKYVESLQGGEKPALVVVGHFHKFDYCYPREVHVIQPGSFKDQDTWMRKKRLQSIVGGCIVHLRQCDLGYFTSVKVEFFPYFDKKFYIYKW